MNLPKKYHEPTLTCDTAKVKKIGHRKIEWTTPCFYASLIFVCFQKGLLVHVGCLCCLRVMRCEKMGLAQPMKPGKVMTVLLHFMQRTNLSDDQHANTRHPAKCRWKYDKLVVVKRKKRCGAGLLELIILEDNISHEFECDTLPKANSSPMKIGRNPKGK